MQPIPATTDTTLYWWGAAIMNVGATLAVTSLANRTGNPWLYLMIVALVLVTTWAWWGRPRPTTAQRVTAMVAPIVVIFMVRLLR
ncbi:MAG TPA: hypothetical protein VNJ02_11610 [Vicinamibacterales bacterium]|nr:hypothetical protein [Vicinamibacterales bacterium]